MRDNIANVFGPRTVEALVPLEASLGDVAHASGYVKSPDAAADIGQKAAEMNRCQGTDARSHAGSTAAGTSQREVLHLASRVGTNSISSSTDGR